MMQELTILASLSVISAMYICVSKRVLKGWQSKIYDTYLKELSYRGLRSTTVFLEPGQEGSSASILHESGSDGGSAPASAHSNAHASLSHGPLVLNQAASSSFQASFQASSSAPSAAAIQGAPSRCSTTRRDSSFSVRRQGSSVRRARRTLPLDMLSRLDNDTG